MWKFSLPSPPLPPQKKTLIGKLTEEMIISLNPLVWFLFSGNRLT
jgi:hypothetical protein